MYEYIRQYRSNMPVETVRSGEGPTGAAAFAGFVVGLVAAIGVNYLWFSSDPGGDSFFKPTLLVAAVTAAVGLTFLGTPGGRGFGIGCVAGAVLSLPVMLAFMWGLFLTVGS